MRLERYLRLIQHRLSPPQYELNFKTMTTAATTIDRKGILRYREDLKPVMLISLLSLLDLAVYLFVDSIPLLIAWFVVVAVPKVMVCAWNHHHQHLSTFRHPLLNRMIEVLYAFHTGVTTNTWVLHHNLGHHLNYLDQTQDESGWKRKDGTTMGELEYTISTAMMGYVKAFLVGRRYPKLRITFLSMSTLTAALLIGLIAFNWVNALFVYVAPMLFGYVATCWHTYSHHAGLDTDNPYEASYNTLHPWYNFLTGNLGYHTAHHLKPGVHWSRLPDLHRSIEDKIPAHLYRSSGVLLSLFPGSEAKRASRQASL